MGCGDREVRFEAILPLLLLLTTEDDPPPPPPSADRNDSLWGVGVEEKRDPLSVVGKKSD